MARRDFYFTSKNYTKAKRKEGWKQVKTPKWRYQTADNYRDGITDNLCLCFPMEPHSYTYDKVYHKALKRIKHKLLFHIPFDETDNTILEKYPHILASAHHQADNIIERDKNRKTTQ